MYETFYDLSADPFRLSPDPAFSYPHPCYQKAMTYMLHALRRAEGLVMITGQPGAGKTTLLSDVVSTISHENIAIARIVSTQLTSNDLLNLIAYSFNLDPEGWGKAKLLVKVEKFLKKQYQHGRRSLLIVDEAQGMGGDSLEELRLLTNITENDHQLLQVFLVGQGQLRDSVNTPHLEQLQQRMIAAIHLEPLDADDTEAYIKHRLHHVNWKGNPLISLEAYSMIHRCSHGIPRRINQICSRLFLHGCTERKHRLGVAEFELVAKELQQELLLPTDNESIYSEKQWPDGQYEETYEEEFQVSPVTSITSPGKTQGPLEFNSAVVESAKHDLGNAHITRDNIPCMSSRVVWAAAVTVLVLLTSMLVVLLKADFLVQNGSDQVARNLSQAEIQSLVLSANYDTGVVLLPALEHQILASEEHTGGGIEHGSGDSSGNSQGYRGLVAVNNDKTLMNPALNSYPIENSPPPPRMAMGDLDKNLQPTDSVRDETVVDGLVVQNESAPSQESVSLALQNNQTLNEKHQLLDREVAESPQLTKEDTIEELLAKGRRSLERDRLTTPREDSAYHYFQQVLELDPGNREAHSGMEQIVARYATLVADALDENDRDKAELYLDRGFSINQNNKDLLALRDRMHLPTKPAKINTEQDPEGFFMRIKQFFTRQPDENLGNQIQADEP